MAARSSIDVSGWLHEQLAQASPDLLREMVKTFAETLRMPPSPKLDTSARRRYRIAPGKLSGAGGGSRALFVRAAVSRT